MSGPSTSGSLMGIHDVADERFLGTAVACDDGWRFHHILIMFKMKSNDVLVEVGEWVRGTIFENTAFRYV